MYVHMMISEQIQIHSIQERFMGIGNRNSQKVQARMVSPPLISCQSNQDRYFSDIFDLRIDFFFRIENEGVLLFNHDTILFSYPGE